LCKHEKSSNQSINQSINHPLIVGSRYCTTGTYYKNEEPVLFLHPFPPSIYIIYCSRQELCRINRFIQSGSHPHPSSLWHTSRTSMVRIPQRLLFHTRHIPPLLVCTLRRRRRRQVRHSKRRHNHPHRHLVQWRSRVQGPPRLLEC